MKCNQHILCCVSGYKIEPKSRALLCCLSHDELLPCRLGVLGDSEVNQRKIICLSMTKAPITGRAGRPEGSRIASRCPELAVAEKEAAGEGLLLALTPRAFAEPSTGSLIRQEGLSHAPEGLWL